MTDISKRNPLVNQEDLRDHEAVSAVFKHPENGKLLIFHHVKYQFWTIPVGKVLPNQGIISAIIQEIKEELDVRPISLRLVGIFKRTYDRGGGIFTTVENHCYEILDYEGELKNNEPHKHDTMTWMSTEELLKIQDNISDSTRFALGLIK